MATIDDARRELVRSRAFIRGAETQLSKALDALDAAMGAAPEPPADPEPPVPEPSGDLVQYPSPEVEFIIGPQLVHGSAENPWPWFDSNQVARAETHAVSALAAPDTDTLLELHYYDLPLCLYGLAYRTGDPAHLQLARDVAADYWQRMPGVVGWESWRSPYAITPRNSGIGGLIVYALDGGGTESLIFEEGPAPHNQIPMTLWEWITEYVREHYQNWVGARIDYPGLYFGIRDGGYMLLYAAQLAAVHPDPAVRSEMLSKALTAATDYYARLQYPNGGWFWEDGGPLWEQPFMVGLLLDGLIAVHRLTDNATVRASILASVDHLWTTYDSTTTVPSLPSARWRAVPYFVYPDGTHNGYGDLEGGWDTNTIREHRQRNTLILHAFGYAYQLTGDPKYTAWGDEIFASTYGKGEGPGADEFYGLADFRGKEYAQAYRSAGRYLAWRMD